MSYCIYSSNASAAEKRHQNDLGISDPLKFSAKTKHDQGSYQIVEGKIKYSATTQCPCHSSTKVKIFAKVSQ